MKNILLFVAMVYLAATGLGCNGDDGLDSQNKNTAVAPQAETHPADSVQAETTQEKYKSVCYANNFEGERFKVVAYKDHVITASRELTNCKLYTDRLKGEVRRPGIDGIREFVGDATAIHGNLITIRTGTLPKICLPKKGEAMTLIWKRRKKMASSDVEG